MKTRSVKSAVSLVLTAVIAVSQIALFTANVSADSWVNIVLKTYDQTTGNESVGGLVGNKNDDERLVSRSIYATPDSKKTIVAEADPGYIFVEWREGSATGATVSSASELEVTATENVTYYAVFEKSGKDTTNTCLGTSKLRNPAAPDSAQDSWKGSYVYFGSYNDVPIKFRVLSVPTSTSPVLFLDCDSILFNMAFDEDSNDWSESDLKEYLNREFLLNFTDLEREILYSDNEEDHNLVDGSDPGQVAGYVMDSFGEYVGLSLGEQAFLLDAEDASNTLYGYYPAVNSGSFNCSSIYKTNTSGTTSAYWLRSAYVPDSSVPCAGSVYNNGYLGFYGVNNNEIGVSPAMKLKSYDEETGTLIIFSSLIAGSFEAESGAEYKLTVLDRDLSISVPAGFLVTINGSEVTIPYQFGDEDASSATRASVLILDKEYGSSDAQILYYNVLGNASSTYGKFTLPSGLDPAKWGTDYYVYILAEDVNGKYETDYASAPFKVSGPNSTQYTVTFLNNWGGVYETQTVNKNGKASLPADPTYGEEEFLGWYVDQAFTTPFDPDNTPIGENTVIYPRFKCKVVVEFGIIADDSDYFLSGMNTTDGTITCAAGTLSVDKTVAEAGEKVKITEATVNDGYEIVGIDWGNGAQGGEPINPGEEFTMPNYTVNVNITYRAKMFTVGVNSGLADPGIAPVGSTVTLNANSAPEGKTFDKWTADVGDVTFADPTAPSTTFTLPAENVVVTANYKDIETTSISANMTSVDFGTIKPGFSEAESDERLVTVRITNTGTSTIKLMLINPGTAPFGNYSFDTAQQIAPGGYMDIRLRLAEADPLSNVEGTYNDIYTFIAKNVSDSYDEFTLTIPVTATISNNCTVTFNTNGGSTVAAQTVTYGSKATKPADPTKSGYTFGGWYTNSACTTAYGFNTAVTADITLYAKWIAESTPTPTPEPTTPTPAPTTPAPTPEPIETPKLTTGIAHVQDIGDVSVAVGSDGVLTIGTTGMGKRLEQITINFENNTPYSGTLQYRVHVQNIGWMEWTDAGQKCGTEGQSLRIEAIEIRFTGELADYYSVEYCVHIQDYGDMQGWVKDGALAGTTGESKRIEELKIRIVPKNSGSSMSVKYRVHVQDYGWEKSYATNGAMSGTSGESKRLEGIELFLSGTQYSGGIKYKTHVQDYGWQSWSYDGEMSGTQGEAKRLEGICIELYGEIAEYYDIYYRVHAQDIGWMAWAKNGECAGTAGRSARLEGIQIVLVPKGSPAPSVTYEGITAVTDKAFVEGF